MGLRFIYGRTGTGKSTYCYSEIKNYVRNNERIYIITPEQFSYSAEKKLLEVLDEKASINAEVISFNRLASRVFTEVGGLNDTLISKSARCMLIYSILEKEKKNLQYLGNSNDNIDLILREITELKKHNITNEKLEEGLQFIDNPGLKEKIKEINNIYKKYEENIQNKYIDEEDILTKLYNKLPESKMFDNTIVYFDEFSGFTKQEYNIFTEILKKAKQVNVIICADNLNKNTEKESDIFYFNKQFAKLLTECGQNVDENIEKNNLINNNIDGNEIKKINKDNLSTKCGQIVNKKTDNFILLNKKYRFKNNELNFIEENIYNNQYKKYNEKNKNLELFIAKNPYTEIEHVAEKITKLVMEENYKYNEIAIITKNIENINSIVKAIFSKYNIPVFFDEKSEITENILIKYVLSILEIYSTNWSTESVFNYIKSGFLNIEKNKIYEIENYCKKNGITRKKFYKIEWKRYEEIRREIIDPLLELKQEIDKEKNAKKISEKLYNYLIKNNIPKILNNKINKLKLINENIIAEEYKSGMDILVDCLDEIAIFFGEEKISLEKYKELLKIGLKNKEFGKIPQAIDQVILGDIDRTRNHKVRAVFIIGINDGIYPSVQKDEGFFNDKDRNKLKEINLEIAKGTIDNLYEDQFNIYKAFTTAEEKLFLSYASSNKEGAALRPSVIISKIKKIFPNLQEKSDIIKKENTIVNVNATFEQLLINIRKINNNENIDDIWVDVYNWYNKNEQWKHLLNKNLKSINYSNKSEKINNENLMKLYGSTLKTSVSKLEQYRECPFSFHLKYGLRIKEQEEYKLNAIDTGSFMHDVIDEFFEEVDDINKIDDTELEIIIEKIINEKLKLEKNYIFYSSAKFVTLTNRLKKTIKQSIKYIIYQIKLSDFKVEGHEVEFTKKIDNIELVGKIDRIDIGKNENLEYVRIIDYKSSEKNIDLNQMMAGTQIQLLTYVDVITEKQHTNPAGVLYFNLIEPIVNTNQNLTDEEIEAKIKQSFKMNGLILADIKIIKMMDKSLEKGASNIIPVYLDKDENISNSRSSTVTKEQFDNLQKMVKKIIKQISNEILNGNIDIKPMYNKIKKLSACKYCPYGTICGFDSSVNTYNYLENKSKELILDEIKDCNNK